MKKWIAMLLALTMLLSLAACAKAPAAENNTNTQPEAPIVDETPAENEAPAENETPAENEAPVENETPSENATPDDAPIDNSSVTGDSSVAQALLMVFRNELQKNPDASALDLAAALASDPMIPFMADSAEMEPGYLNGFSEDITGFAECAFFGPMISSIPFCGYIFKLEDGADVDAFVENLNAKADLAWNICTEADEKLVEAQGNTVFFVMAPYAFSE